MDPNPLPDVDPDAYVAAEQEVVDIITRLETPDPPVAHPLPALGETVEYQGRQFLVRDATVSTKAYANPGHADERVMLTLRLTAWEGEAPFEDPANASMF